MLRKGLRLWISVVGMGLAVCAAAGRAQTAPEQLAAFGEGAVPVEDGWAFHTGDDASWAAPGFDDSGWERLSAVRPWGQQGHAGYQGFAWYRRRLDLRPAAGETADFALLLPEVDQAYEVYWNGVLVGQYGSLPPHPVWYVRQTPRVFRLQGGGAGVLAVRVWNAPPLSDEDPGLKGGFLATPLVGTPGAIADAKAALDFRWLRGHQFLFMLNLVYGLVGLLSLLAFVRNREQWILLWMTGFTLSQVLTLLLLNARIPYSIAMSLSEPLLAVRDISVWFLLLWLLDLREDARLAQWTRALSVISLAATVLDAGLIAVAWRPALTHAAQAGDAFLTAVYTVLEVYPLVLVVLAAVRRKRLDAADIAVAISAFAVEMVHVVHDAALQGERYTHWRLAGRLDHPIAVLNGSAVSLVDALEVVLFICAAWAVFRRFFEERKRQQELSQELRNARELQRVLVPDAPVELKGFRVTSAYFPAKEVGGDFFQVLPAGDALLVMVGDVSGKGLRAAIAVSFLVGMVRALVTLETRPAELLKELNLRMIGRLQGGFVTCLAMRVEANGCCRTATAGHPGPFIGAREMETEGALPLGLFAEVEYGEAVFELRQGETCSLYTDGLLEARDRDGELFGFARLARLFSGQPTAQEAAQAAVEFGQDDDITVLTVTRLAGDRTAEHAGAPCLEADKKALAG